MGVCGVMPWPKWGKDAPATTGAWGGNVLAIPKSSKNKEAALKWALFIGANAETQLKIWQEGHLLPAYEPALKSEVLAKGETYLGDQSIYETAIEISRRRGPFDPPLYLLLDEAANIAPVRDLAPWLSQCGDHGITIATSWQSLAQSEQRYGKPGRDAILAASTAQLFIPPIADPATVTYITELTGHEPVVSESRNGSMDRKTITLSIGPSSPTTLPQRNRLSSGFPQVRSRATLLQIICSESPS